MNERSTAAEQTQELDEARARVRKYLDRIEKFDHGAPGYGPGQRPDVIHSMYEQHDDDGVNHPVPLLRSDIRTIVDASS